MKTRKSLAQKIECLTKLGTLSSFSKEDAVKFMKEEWGQEEHKDYLKQQLTKIDKYYAKGFVLCFFKPSNSPDIFQVYQFTKNLNMFVQELIYPTYSNK